MNGAFYIGATGLQSQQRALDVVAHNIANMNTPAFKRSEIRFAQMVMTPERAPSVVGAVGAELGGVGIGGEHSVFTQGELRETGDRSSLAIRGDGFIELLGPAGRTLLWRGGALTVGADGFLAGANGLPLKAMISVPLEASEVEIDSNGAVRAAGEVIGQIELVRLKDTSAISTIGTGLYATPSNADVFAALPGEDGAGVLVQGSIEASNVALSEEMISLLLMQRAYAANAQVVQAGDQLMAIANGLKR